MDLATDLDVGNLEATATRLGLRHVPKQFFFFLRLGRIYCVFEQVQICIALLKRKYSKSNCCFLGLTLILTLNLEKNGS